MADIPVNFKIMITPVGRGVTVEADAYRPGSVEYTTIPQGPRVGVINASDVQIVSLQKYIQAIRNGVGTSGVETATGALTV